jgi:hypothetical protein
MKIKSLFLISFLTTKILALGIEIGVGAKYQAAESYHPNLIDANLSTAEAITNTRISLLMHTEITSISFLITPQKGTMVVFDETRPDVKYTIEFDGKSDTARLVIPKVKMKNIIFGWMPDEYGNKLTLKEIIVSSNNKEQLEIYDRIHRLLYKK